MAVSSVMKFIVVFVAALAHTLVNYLADDHLSQAEIYTALVEAFMAIGVYVVPNWPYPTQTTQTPQQK